MKKRIDVVLVEKNLCESREKAKANIMSGNVYVNNTLVDKAGTMIEEDCEITFKQDAIPYVSRGGLKLQKALHQFNLDLDGKICMDVGASTGGFTDCMLKEGAIKVYSVDVGYGQLDWKLRNDSKVVCMERTNIRYLDTTLIKEKMDFISVDVSFISLKLVIPVLAQLIHESSDIILLIKPQFEAGREEVSKHSGVIKDKKIHERVILEITDFLRGIGFLIRNLSYSPIKGPKGNIEFLLHVDKKTTKEIAGFDIRQVVEYAHEELS